jgi:hypothetical protein
VRACSLCNAQDHPLILPDYCNCQGGNDLAGHATGCKSIEHFVTRDIREHKGPVPLAMKRKGWAELGIFQGKQAIQRLLCRTCIRKQDDVIEIEAYKLKMGKELEEGTDMDMYHILCN